MRHARSPDARRPHAARSTHATGQYPVHSLPPAARARHAAPLLPAQTAACLRTSAVTLAVSAHTSRRQHTVHGTRYTVHGTHAHGAHESRVSSAAAVRIQTVRYRPSELPNTDPPRVSVIVVGVTHPLCRPVRDVPTQTCTCGGACRGDAPPRTDARCKAARRAHFHCLTVDNMRPNCAAQSALLLLLLLLHVHCCIGQYHTSSSYTTPHRHLSCVFHLSVCSPKYLYICINSFSV